MSLSSTYLDIAFLFCPSQASQTGCQQRLVVRRRPRSLLGKSQNLQYIIWLTVRCSKDHISSDVGSRGLEVSCRDEAYRAKPSGVLVGLCMAHCLSCTNPADAYAVRNHLTSLIDERSQLPLKRHIFSSDVAVQTDSVMVGTSPPPEEDVFPRRKESPTDDDVISKLTAADLASILKWSKEISRDINLSLALQRLTEIATGKLFTEFSKVFVERLNRNCRKSKHLCCHRPRSG